MISGGLFTAGCAAAGYFIADTLPISGDSAVSLSLLIAVIGGVAWISGDRAAIRTEVKDLRELMKTEFKNVKSHLGSLPCSGRKQCREDEDSRI